MHFQFLQPSGFLKGFIRHYCLMETGHGEEDMKERVVPVENVQLMFHYKTPFAVCNSNGSFSVQPRTIISGLSSSYSDVVTRGEAGVIFVSFHTAGACNFFPFPLSELDNKNIDLTHILGKEVRQVEEQLCHAPDAPGKVKLVEQFLMKIFAPVAAPDYALVQKGIETIISHGGQISASALAGMLSISSKTLERKFAACVGKTPKQFGKLIRFRTILSGFSSSKNINLTEFAYRNGYFDQSHFIHDFRMYCGYTPGEFLSKYPGYNIDDGYCDF